MAANSFWSQWLEESPNILYEALRPQQGAYSFLDYWRRQQGNVYGNYLGQLGRTALGGQAPTQSFMDYMTSYPWLQRWLGLPPEERGERQSLYAPRMRWAY